MFLFRHFVCDRVSVCFVKIWVFETLQSGSTLATRTVETIGWMTHEIKMQCWDGSKATRKMLESKHLFSSVIRIASYVCVYVRFVYVAVIEMHLANHFSLAFTQKKRHNETFDKKKRTQTQRNSNSTKREWFGGANSMYVVHSVYFVSSPKIACSKHTKCKTRESIHVVNECVSVSFLCSIAIFYLACTCFAANATITLMLLSSSLSKRMCSMCIFAFRFWPKNLLFAINLILFLSRSLSCFFLSVFVVTVDCSRLKLTPKYHHANCLFVCLRVFFLFDFTASQTSTTRTSCTVCCVCIFNKQHDGES